MRTMTSEEAAQHVVSTNPIFAIHEVEVRGVTLKAFKNVPPTVPALFAASWSAHGNGQFEYLAYEDEKYTYADFTQLVNRMAHALQNELGLKKGDRIAIVMRNYPEFLVLMC